ncbi:MAG: ATP-binding protein [Rhodanobacter sp.]
MTGSAELQVLALSDLDTVARFVDFSCERAGADADSRFALRLAVEESFSNIMQHGYGADGGPVTVQLHAQHDRISVTLRDRAPAFVPEQVPAPDLAASWQQRKVGGLGWHLVRQVMDEVSYERDAEGENVLTLVKYLSGGTIRS